MSEKKKLWVVVEHHEGKIKAGSLEALHAASSLAGQCDGYVTAVYLDAPDKEVRSDEMIHNGADRVLILRNEHLDQYTSGGYLGALSQEINSERPLLIFFSGSNQGKEISAGLATKLGSGFASDCIAVEWDDETGLTVRRPVYAGKAHSVVVFETDDQHVVTLRPNVFRGEGPDPSRSGVVNEESIEFPWDSTGLLLKEVVQATGERIDITEARIVVSGGLGMQGPENFWLIEELADVLGAAVGASRPVVDNGWRQYSNQVGQTGRTVSPDLYIACGISGAVQHLAGMSSAKIIVAINKDAHAPIFSIADYGIVGDALEVLPLLTAEFKKVLAAH